METENQSERAFIGLFVGGALGGAAYWLTKSTDCWWVWAVFGGGVGLFVGLLWPLIESFLLRQKLEDWRLEEIEIQGLKFTTAGAQRRVAWRLFVEIATRIATQPMEDESGDDGVALKSLYDLFQLTRKAIGEMQPTSSASGNTVETYALEMLNSDLRPFLSKWHLLWDEFQKRGGQQPWDKHQSFRDELRVLQGKVQRRAEGLAQLAGVKDVERFFPQHR